MERIAIDDLPAITREKRTAAREAEKRTRVRIDRQRAPFLRLILRNEAFSLRCDTLIGLWQNEFEEMGGSSEGPWIVLKNDAKGQVIGRGRRTLLTHNGSTQSLRSLNCFVVDLPTVYDVQRGTHIVYPTFKAPDAKAVGYGMGVGQADEISSLAQANGMYDSRLSFRKGLRLRHTAQEIAVRLAICEEMATSFEAAVSNPALNPQFEQLAS